MRLARLGCVTLGLVPEQGMTSELERAIRLADERAPMLRRLRRVEDWRRARFQRLLEGPDRGGAIKAARLYLEVGTRRMALERGVI